MRVNPSSGKTQILKTRLHNLEIDFQAKFRDLQNKILVHQDAQDLKCSNFKESISNQSKALTEGVDEDAEFEA